jgi:hypothetical protein
MRRALFSISASLSIFVVTFIVGNQQVSALGLKVAPQFYSESLQAGEKKKAFIDVSNPDDQPRNVAVDISGFKQTNNDGDLSFFAAPEYGAGIILDYTNFTLGPRESLRLFFVIDSDNLPKGGVYATIFFSVSQPAVNPDQTSIQPAVKVGTLLIIDNSGGGVRQAEIRQISAPFFQFGEKISAVASVENSSPNGGLAFFPTIESSIQPFGVSSQQTTSPLIFPGITRQTELNFQGNHFGPVRLVVSTGDSVKYRWTFVATGYGRLVAPTIIFLAMYFVISKNYRGRARRVLKKISRQ